MYVTETVLCPPGHQRELVDRYKAQYPPAAYGTVVLEPVHVPSPNDAQEPWPLRFWRKRFPSVS